MYGWRRKLQNHYDIILDGTFAQSMWMTKKNNNIEIAAMKGGSVNKHGSTKVIVTQHEELIFCQNNLIW